MTMTPFRFRVLGANFLTLVLTLALGFFGCSSENADEDPSPKEGGPRVLSFSASKTRIALGESVTISWRTEGAAIITLASAPGGTLLDASSMIEGAISSQPLTTTTVFTLTAASPAGTDVRSLTVSIDPLALGVLAFEATPNPARRGGVTSLSWRTSGATSVRILEGDTELFINSTTLVASGSYLAALHDEEITTFAVEAGNGAERTRKEIIVRTEAAPEILEFRVSERAFSGSSAQITVTWSTRNASTVELTGNGLPVPGFTPNTATATITVPVASTTRFQLVAASAAGTRRATQVVVQTIPEVEPNDTITSAQALNDNVSANGSISPRDTDFYRVTVPAGGNIYAEVSDGNGGCNFDSLIDLYDSDGSTLLGGNDDDGPDTCSEIDARRDTFAASLAAGTYTLSVRGFSETAVGNYTLTVLVGGPGCGNGITEALNGGNSEQCDDENTDSGDGCDAACAFEIRATVGPPFGTAILDLPSTNSFGLVRVEVTQPGQAITATTSDGAGGCSIDTLVFLLDPNFELLGLDHQDEPGQCGKILFPTDAFATNLAVGSYYVGVLNESASGGSVTLDVGILDPDCANRVIETRAGEQCDDGNLAPGDGCDPACQFNTQAIVTGPGAGGTQTFTGALEAPLQQDVYQIVLTAPGYIRAETFVPTAPSCTGPDNDTLMILTDSTGSELGRNDQGGVENCSRIDPALDSFASVGTGTYFLLVRAYDATTVPTYSVEIRALGQGCGNGVVETGEGCDDGNRTPGDQCGSACAFEGPSESEANDAFQTANSLGSAPILHGSIDPVGDADWFRVTVPEGRHIEAYLTKDSLETCAPSSSYQGELSLYAPDGSTVLQEDASAGAGSRCGRIAPDTSTSAVGLAGGTYFLRVTERSGGIMENYFLHVRLIDPGCGNRVREATEQCDDGNTAAGDGCSPGCSFEGNVTLEVEPNDSLAEARPSMAALSSTVTVSGAIGVVGDADYWSFDVPAGQTATLVARTYSDVGDAGSCNARTDTRIYLVDAQGTEIDDDDDGAEGVCSLIDGHSTDHVAARNLPSGRYAIRVQHYDNSAPVPEYFMNVRLDP